MTTTTTTARRPVNRGHPKHSLRLDPALREAIATRAGGDLSGWIREAIRERLARENGAGSLLETLGGRLSSWVRQALEGLAALYREQGKPVGDREVISALEDAIMGASVASGSVVAWRTWKPG